MQEGVVRRIRKLWTLKLSIDFYKGWYCENKGNMQYINWNQDRNLIIEWINIICSLRTAEFRWLSVWNS